MRLSITDRQSARRACARPSITARRMACANALLDWGITAPPIVRRWGHSPRMSKPSSRRQLPAERRELETSGIGKALRRSQPSSSRTQARTRPIAEGRAGGSLHHGLPRNARTAATLPPPVAAHGYRPDPHVLALPSCVDGGADDRAQDRHRRLVGACLSEEHGRTSPHIRRPFPAFDVPHPALFAAGAAGGRKATP